MSKMKGLSFINFPKALVSAAAMLFCPNCLAQSSAAEDATVSSRLDAHMSAMTDSGLFMGAALVAKDGKVLLSRGYGMANLELEIPNVAHTRFDIGSVSKTFTAALVLLLVEDLHGWAESFLNATGSAPLHQIALR